MRNLMPTESKVRPGRGFWARFWEGLRGSLGGVCC